MTSRRQFLGQLSAFGLALTGIPRLPIRLRPRFQSSPFTLGVASGDPTPGGVVLWTRLAPSPLEGGGMPNEAVRVRWEIAADEGMRQIVRRGTETARPDLAHSVHAEVEGLDPARWYWYRFDVGGEASPVGRTRTAPAAGTTPERLRFAFASCQHYEQGLYTAYRHMAAEDLELVAHLGDYIYERGTAPDAPEGSLVRRHPAEETSDLRSYRHRYALYKADADLQAAHAAFPWIVTWDDHEVDNNYADGFAQDSTPRDAFLLRRAAAYQAYYEHQPLRRASLPRGPDMLLYRSLAFGSLARFHVLDTRQYRSDQACGDGNKATCPEWSDPSRTMLGATQERWLTEQVRRSSAVWSVLTQQVSLVSVGNPARPELVYMDGWSGYPVARDRLVGFMAEQRPRNFVVLTGDIHASFVMDVNRRVDDTSTPLVATEFMGTSISSAGDGRERWPTLRDYENTIPAMKWHSARRGYVRCEVTAREWVTDYRLLPYVRRPGAPVETKASFVVEAGRPGAVAR
jgi:alkaline phosphatase D